MGENSAKIEVMGQDDMAFSPRPSQNFGIGGTSVSYFRPVDHVVTALLECWYPGGRQVHVKNDVHDDAGISSSCTRQAANARVASMSARSR